MNYLHLTQTLAESFSALADEVQSLIDRKTILEHKLRYAREQVRTDTILHFFPQCAQRTLPFQNDDYLSSRSGAASIKAAYGDEVFISDFPSHKPTFHHLAVCFPLLVVTSLLIRIPAGAVPTSS